MLIKNGLFILQCISSCGLQTTPAVTESEAIYISLAMNAYCAQRENSDVLNLSILILKVRLIVHRNFENAYVQLGKWLEQLIKIVLT